MAKKPTLVEQLDEANNDTWIGSFESDPAEVGPLHRYWNASRKLISSHCDEELAELIAQKPDSREAHLAASIMRRRESWRTPATPALIISLLSFGLAAWAFARTF